MFKRKLKILDAKDFKSKYSNVQQKADMKVVKEVYNDMVQNASQGLKKINFYLNDNQAPKKVEEYFKNKGYKTKNELIEEDVGTYMLTISW